LTLDSLTWHGGCGVGCSLTVLARDGGGVLLLSPLTSAV
jgi:hypothetical protein